MIPPLIDTPYCCMLPLCFIINLTFRTIQNTFSGSGNEWSLKIEKMLKTGKGRFKYYVMSYGGGVC